MITPEILNERMVDVSVQLEHLVSRIIPNDDDEYLCNAARSRMLELRTILAVLTGKGKAWSPHMRPLTQAVNDFIAKLDEQNNGVIENDSNIEEALAVKEEVADLLDQARVAALSMLANLNAAVEKIPQLQRVK